MRRVYRKCIACHQRLAMEFYERHRRVCRACRQRQREERNGLAGKPGPLPPPSYPDHVLVCECSRCGRELLAPGQGVDGEVVAGRVYGRPVCGRCRLYALKEPKPAECSFGHKAREY